MLVASRRSVTHGTCALNGRHTPGSVWEAECHVRRAQAAAAQETASVTFTARPGVSTGSAISLPAKPRQTGRIRQVDVTAESPGTGTVRPRGGRPRKYATARAAHVAAQRAYRARQQARTETPRE
jgi:hypothetical protein